MNVSVETVFRCQRVFMRSILSGDVSNDVDNIAILELVSPWV